MADDNVTDLPNQPNDKGGGRKKTPAQLIGEIRASFNESKAKEFKAKVQEKMKEAESLKKSLALVEAEITRMIAEYEAEQ